MVQVGVGLPNGGVDVDVAELARLAIGAEEIGVDAVWVMDRWLRPHAPVNMPGVPVPITLPAQLYASVLDPIDVLAFLAARTSRIGLGTSAINVLLHPPVLLARRLATVDQLSGGRLLAGVTAGWMAEEFAVAGVPQARAGAGLDEHLAAVRAVWGPDPVAFDGAHYTVPVSDIGPKPVQDGGVPLVMGYTTAAGIRRAARIADGLHPYRNDADTLAADLALWRTALAAAGRDADQQRVVLRAAAAFDRPDALFGGGPAAWAADLDVVGKLGVEHVVLQLPAGSTADRTLDAFAALLALR